MKEVTRAIIVNDMGDVLVGKRARKDGVGLWALVGGKLDPDETPLECVIREVKEELGLVFQPTLWKEEIDNTSDGETEWKVYYFIGKATGSIKNKEDEITETRYVSLSDLTSLEFAFGHRKVLSEFFTQNITT